LKPSVAIFLNTHTTCYIFSSGLFSEKNTQQQKNVIATWLEDEENLKNGMFIIYNHFKKLMSG